MSQIDLHQYGITVEDCRRNLAPAVLYQEAIRAEKGTVLANSGALIAYSGSKTGRSPKDKHIVRHPDSEKDVWWGPVNVAVDESTFNVNRERAIEFTLSTRLPVGIRATGQESA